MTSGYTKPLISLRVLKHYCLLDDLRELSGFDVSCDGPSDDHTVWQDIGTGLWQIKLLWNSPSGAQIFEQERSSSC